jgi:hypothetical protein
MTLNSSGPINIGGTSTNASIEQEINGSTFSYPYVSMISLNDATVRTLAGKSSGQISFSDFYGKSNIPVTRFDGTIRLGYETISSPSSYLQWCGLNRIQFYPSAIGTVNTLFGTHDPATTFPDGKELAVAMDYGVAEDSYNEADFTGYRIITIWSEIVITSSVDPTQSYFTRAKNETTGNELFSAAATEYSYTSNRARWRWQRYSYGPDYTYTGAPNPSWPVPSQFFTYGFGFVPSLTHSFKLYT